MIERLSKLLADAEEEGLFLETVKAAPGIGDMIGRNLLESVTAWDPEEDERIEVPFAESTWKHPDGDSLTRYHDTDVEADAFTRSSDDTDESDDGQAVQSTTLDDF